MFGYNKRKKEVIELLKAQFLDIINGSLFLEATFNTSLLENETYKALPIALINALQIEPPLFFKFLGEAGRYQKDKLEFAIDLEKLKTENKFIKSKIWYEQMLSSDDSDYFSNSTCGIAIGNSTIEMAKDLDMPLIELCCYFFMSSW